MRRAVTYFVENINRQTQRNEAVGTIGEDLFAIATDQPFRFPATFTFVLRAFSTLEGIGKTLNPDYKFNQVAAPYVQELLQLQDSAAARGLVLDQLQQQVVEAGSAAAAMPSRIARIENFAEQLESGDLKLRVRVLEAERAARRTGVIQMATMQSIGAVGFLNVGTMLALDGRTGPAAGVLGLAGVFGVMMLLGFKRVKRLDKFEKDLRA